MRANHRAMTWTAVIALTLGATACSRAGDGQSAKSSDGQSAKSNGLLSKIEQRGELIVGVKYDSPPYGSLNPATNLPEGFDIDMARKVAEHIVGSPDKVKFVQVSTATRIPMLQQGDIDLSVATITITDKRRQQVDFSTPYYPSGMAVMVTSDSPLSTPEVLAGKTNCITTGSTSHDLVIKALKEKYGIDSIKSIALGSYPECVLALKQGRADFVGTDQGTLVGLAKQSSGVKVLPQLLSSESWGMAVAKGNTDLLDAVNASIATAFKDGTWTKAYEKWVDAAPPQDWPPRA